MPERILVEQQQTTSIGYQVLTVTHQIVETNDQLTYKLKLEHTGARAWEMAGLTGELVCRFLPTVNIRTDFGYIIEGRTRDRLSVVNSVRNEIRMDLRAHTSSGEWRPTLPMTDQVSTAFNIWSSSWPDRTGLVDRILDQAVEILVQFLGQMDCPDGVDGCAAIHRRPAREEHIITELGNHVIPSEFGGYIEGIHGEGLYYWISDPRGSLPALINLAGMFQCLHCESVGPNDASMVLREPPGAFRNPAELHFCQDCYYGSIDIAYCEHCGVTYLDEHGTWQPVYDDNGDPYDDDEFVCLGCSGGRENNGDRRLELNNYSFKPTPVFYAKVMGNEAPFMGMELEVGRNSYTPESNKKINDWIRKNTGFMYMKGDSSVSYGMEIVTHPFTYEWAKDNFPYPEFADLINLPLIVPDHTSCGTHIHVNKADFTLEHMWKFILFFIENKEFFGIAGGRGHAHSYGSFMSHGTEQIRRNLMQIVKAKGNSSGFAVGRDAVNISPENTIELRFMAGDVRPKMIKKNQQMVQAVFDYTKMVRAQDAMKGALHDPGYFLGFLEDTDYQELYEYITRAMPQPKKLERIS